MKRILSFVLALALLASLGVCAFADGGAEKLTMSMDRNGKIVTYADGTRAKGRVLEKCHEQLYYLMHRVPINWDLFDRAELEMELDADGVVTVTSQTMYALNGSKLVNSNPMVAILESPTKLHPTGAGSADISLYGADGTLLQTAAISVTGSSFSTFSMTNTCSVCSEEEGSGFHLMSCGHFLCQTGSAGHGAASCGTLGHFACDGANHSICYNCLRPLCNGGEHGEGICPHAHTPQFAGWEKRPTCTKWGIAYIRCAVCGWGFAQSIAPSHSYDAREICTVCGAKKADVEKAE